MICREFECKHYVSVNPYGNRPMCLKNSPRFVDLIEEGVYECAAAINAENPLTARKDFVPAALLRSRNARTG